MIPVEVTLDRAGRTPYRLTPSVTNLRWTTAAIGGFGSCTFNLPGPPPFWRRELPALSILRVTLDTFVIWEGQVEDLTMSLLDETTQVQCFGLQRLLSLSSVRRIWSQREIPFVQRSPQLVTPDPAFEVTTGTFDQSDQTKIGIQFVGNGQTCSTAKANQWLLIAPTGLTYTRVRCLYEKAGSANFSVRILS